MVYPSSIQKDTCDPFLRASVALRVPVGDCRWTRSWKIHCVGLVALTGMNSTKVFSVFLSVLDTVGQDGFTSAVPISGKDLLWQSLQSVKSESSQAIAFSHFPWPPIPNNSPKVFLTCWSCNLSYAIMWFLLYVLTCGSLYSLGFFTFS